MLLSNPSGFSVAGFGDVVCCADVTFVIGFSGVVGSGVVVFTNNASTADVSSGDGVVGDGVVVSRLFAIVVAMGDTDPGHSLRGVEMQGAPLPRIESPPLIEVNAVVVSDTAGKNDDDNTKILSASEVFILKI